MGNNELTDARSGVPEVKYDTCDRFSVRIYGDSDCRSGFEAQDVEGERTYGSSYVALLQTTVYLRINVTSQNALLSTMVPLGAVDLRCGCPRSPRRVHAALLGALVYCAHSSGAGAREFVPKRMLCTSSSRGRAPKEIATNVIAPRSRVLVFSRCRLRGALRENMATRLRPRSFHLR
ncbi:hypothetical protein OH76DRAFT_277948 [Lentinus brumalis]|uniref:Uncharacterized protein n=1 Tax=Lentinus brumalis TaxID=2498619 RepID=A0A371CKZ4_9APHY|nr:hypothetical protein OH76DRAFT_277948 [Polyporus brumalis]